MIETGKLIMLRAFNLDEDSVLRDAFEPVILPTRGAAIAAAQAMVGMHEGVMASMRDVDPLTEQASPLTVLFQAGEVPDIA